jgi:ABC-type bacteriocin/lantibiotic exporter with double-glycine peptidase domain
VQNALRALGHKVREDHIAQYAGTTHQGTNEFGLMAALTKLEYSFTILNERKYSVAEGTLFTHLKTSSAIILAEAGDHWVAGIGTLGDRVVVFDSQMGVANRKENGVHVLQRGEQLRRWWLPCEGKRYAILIHS